MQHEINRLMSEVKRLKAENKHWRTHTGVSQHSSSPFHLSGLPLISRSDYWLPENESNIFIEVTSMCVPVSWHFL